MKADIANVMSAFLLQGVNTRKQVLTPTVMAYLSRYRDNDATMQKVTSRMRDVTSFK